MGTLLISGARFGPGTHLALREAKKNKNNVSDMVASALSTN